jgi:E3 ubiquitin-protein ligase BOI and related proteins
MSLNNYHPEEAGQLARTGNPGAVSTGLRLSCEDDERNSSVTSGGGSLSSLTTAMPFADDLIAQLDKENKEMGYYLKLQVNIRCCFIYHLYLGCDVFVGLWMWHQR